MCKEKIHLTIKGHVLIKDLEGNTLYDDHNDVQPETAWILLRALSGNPLSHLGIGVGKITSVYDSTTHSQNINNIDLESLSNEITFKALIPHDAFSGEITELRLQNSEGYSFSIIPGISITKGINTALMINWKITFGII